MSAASSHKRAPGAAPDLDPLVAVLAATVSGSPVQRVAITALRAAFARHDPTGATAAGSRARLAAAVEALRAQGVVTLPALRSGWERHVEPPLPNWVQRPAAPRPARPTGTPRVWRDELALAGVQARTVAEVEVVTAVEAFLAAGGTHRPLVPYRERSAEVFGHEKRLDALLSTKLFRGGALSLELLRCYSPALPLAAQLLAPALQGEDVTLLLTENHHTYASLLEHGRARVAAGDRRVLAVGYGSGNQLAASISGAAQLAPVPTCLAYFGDLDLAGLDIAARVSAAAVAAGLPAVQPAAPLYAALLEQARPQPGHPIAPEQAHAAASWLGDVRLHEAVAGLLSGGHRIAQEQLGGERLAVLSSWL